MSVQLSENARRGLQAMVKANSGATVAEQQQATHALLNGGLRAPLPSKTGEDRWVAEGMLIFTKDGIRRYLRQSALKHFLDYVPECRVFTYHDFSYQRNVFGSGDFNIIRHFLLEMSLMRRVAGGYMISSQKAIREAWNTRVMQGMVL